MEFIKSLAERVLNGEKLSKEDGLKILSIDDQYVMDLVEEAAKVREAVFKNQMEFCSLINAKMELVLKIVLFVPSLLILRLLSTLTLL